MAHLIERGSHCLCLSNEIRLYKWRETNVPSIYVVVESRLEVGE
jgi:hypothetical protein